MYVEPHTTDLPCCIIVVHNLCRCKYYEFVCLFYMMVTSSLLLPSSSVTRLLLTVLAVALLEEANHDSNGRIELIPD